ncbi:hypothetical protein [Lysinibacillus xylanilyticus]|uniref:Uncharacterized protein n=1 Tax=Lysinibacillus xylanilyticus TaxID=582475 RepID=A0ABT4EV68_9BACI|nr:hypothetical protein [Lysinibacillus xylanilyticus]MCY9549428.1 hypothetical protein [Lysinibacillus xylanilyticus]
MTDRNVEETEGAIQTTEEQSSDGKDRRNDGRTIKTTDRVIEVTEEQSSDGKGLRNDG